MCTPTHPRNAEILRALAAAALVIALAPCDGLAKEPIGAEPVAADPGKLPAGVSADWWSAVTHQIAQEEYQVSRRADGTPVAPNPAHGFETTFGAGGFHIRPVEGSWSCGLTFFRWGRPAALQTIAPAAAVAEGSRVELRRERLLEWFENGPEGLEQGWTIPGPPEGARGELVLDLRLSGDLRPMLASDGSAFDFFDEGSVSVLRYGKLVVVDARGERLPARFVALPGAIRIAIEDASAVYPVVVDPLATSASWTGSGDEDDVSYGLDLATAGDVNADGYSDVIVGASGHDGGGGVGANRGRAYLYLGSASGLPASTAWTGTGNENGALYGWSVSTAGDVNGDGHADVLVGARAHDAGAGAGADRGQAYVYLGSPLGLQASPSWTGSGDENGASFGYAAGAAADVNGDGYGDVVIGAMSHDAGAGPNEDRGRAYVYLGTAAGLQPSASWIGSGDENRAHYGNCVGTAGDVNGDGFSDVVVGAVDHDGGGGSSANRGRAYVYLGSPAGLQPAASWTGTGEYDSDYYARSAAAAGDVNGDGYADVLVAAPYHRPGGSGPSYGRTYLYLGSPAGLQSSAAWSALGNTSNAGFGSSVGTAGDVNGDGYADVVVGAPDHPAGGSAQRGQAYLFLGSSSGLAASAWTGSGDEDLAYYGYAASTAGDVNGDGYSDVIVGAYGHDAGFSNRGRAYLYAGSPAGLRTASSWSGSGDENGAYLGAALATGDVNGDGFTDVAIGASGHDAGAGAYAERGRAYVFAGSATGLAASPSWTSSGDENSAYFGSSIATTDVNGDGYADVVVGAWGEDAGGLDRGRAYVYLGSAAGVAASPSWTSSGDENAALYGDRVGAAGDVNGDGYGDVVAGAPGHDAGAGSGADRGRAYLYLGSAAGLLAAPSWTMSGDESQAYFGRAVSGAGDVNGDGYSDVIVAAYYHDAGAGASANRGRAYVFLGSATGLPSSAAWSASGDESGAFLGYAACTAGDVNGDGYADVVVGAFGHDAGAGASANRGRAYVYLGSPSGPLVSPSWIGSGDENDASYGFAASAAGDVNGDGYTDLIVGALAHDAGAGASANRGRAYVYLGSSTGLLTTASWTGSGGEDSANYGQSVAGGDVNGDGYGDVLVAAPWHDAGGGAAANRGQTYLHLGNDGAALTVRPRQLRADLSAPIAPRGLAHEMNLRLGLRLRTPFGRGMVKLQWQAVALGETFNPVWHPVQSGSLWWDSRVIPVDRNELVSLGSVPGPFTWRVRVRYGIAASPFQPHGPWVTLDGNGLRETDCRAVLAPPPPPCVAPDEAVLIASVTLNAQGMPVLHVQDPNQPTSVTGYNVYRATSPAGPFALVASDVVDMDEGTPNVQWVDQNGAVGGPYYYSVKAYNHTCPAEGP